MERVCNNCKLYNDQDSTCRVRLIVHGEVMRDIPVDPGDSCLWEEFGLAEHIQEVRFKCVDPITGKIAEDGHGKIVMEYTDPYFFGDRPEFPKPDYNEAIRKLKDQEVETDGLA